MATEPLSELPEAARRAIDRARAAPLSYAVRTLRAPDGRLLVVLGEAHMKLEGASGIGKAVVGSFELRGVETFQRDRVFGGRTLGVVIHGPRMLLRALSLGALKGSTITDAKQLPSGYTVELERTKDVPFGLHVASVYLSAFFIITFLAMAAPLFREIAPGFYATITVLAVGLQLHCGLLVPGLLVRRHPWSWLVHPLLGILSLRDELMAAGTIQMLADHPREKSAVVVMGRAHVQGYERILVERHRFTRI
jgi:hypothetical protein